MIVKPAASDGSDGVRLCRTVDQMSEDTTCLLGGKHKWRSSPRKLVEGFAQGLFFCADTIGNEVIAISAGDFGPPPHFVFRQFAFPALLTDTGIGVSPMSHRSVCELLAWARGQLALNPGERTVAQSSFMSSPLHPALLRPRRYFSVPPA